MRGDFLTANALGRALYAPLFDSGDDPPNVARFTFLDPAAQQFFTEWDKAARDLVASLRAEAGRNPYDRALTHLVGELSTRSEPFRKWWAAHDVRHHQTGRKRLRHPTVGDLELDYEVTELSADSGLSLAVFSAEPGSRSAEALDLVGAGPPRPRQSQLRTTPRGPNASACGHCRLRVRLSHKGCLRPDRARRRRAAPFEECSSAWKAGRM